MASLVTPALVKILVKTGLTDAELQTIIDLEEAEVIRLFGAHYTGASQEITETLHGGGKSLWLRRRIVSVTSISEDGLALTSGEYRVWPDEGRIQRLSGVTAWLSGDDDDTIQNKWGQVIVIVYKPADDSTQRKPVIIELVRLALERTSMQSESVGGEYSYTAPIWEERRAQMLKRLSLGRT